MTETEGIYNAAGLAKYSIVPKFWTSPTEIEATEIVGSFNPESGMKYINFIDTQGRLWKMLETDAVVVNNYPTKEDMDDMERLKKEADAHKKLLESKKNSKDKEHNREII